jgi:hypothetical protein
MKVNFLSASNNSTKSGSINIFIGLHQYLCPQYLFILLKRVILGGGEGLPVFLATNRVSVG